MCTETSEAKSYVSFYVESTDKKVLEQRIIWRLFFSCQYQGVYSYLPALCDATYIMHQFIVITEVMTYLIVIGKNCFV